VTRLRKQVAHAIFCWTRKLRFAKSMDTAMKTTGMHTRIEGAATLRYQDSRWGGSDAAEVPCAFSLPIVNLCGGLWHS
jgi:hypothetical protein